VKLHVTENTSIIETTACRSAVLFQSSIHTQLTRNCG